jgi:hypothetical protein
VSNNSASSIRTTLSTHLSAVTQLKQVKVGRDLDTSLGFPYCRFYLVGVSSEQFDNRPSDFRSYRFAVDVFQEVNAASKADAEAYFEDAVDAVMDKLNAQWQVKDGSNVATVDTSVIQSSFVVLTEAPQGPAVYLQLIVECKTLVY